LLLNEQEISTPVVGGGFRPGIQRVTFRANPIKPALVAIGILALMVEGNIKHWENFSSNSIAKPRTLQK
jgi:hypothetical protein